MSSFKVSGINLPARGRFATRLGGKRSVRAHVAAPDAPPSALDTKRPDSVTVSNIVPGPKTTPVTLPSGNKLEPLEQRVGMRENAVFQQHPSVEIWRGYECQPDQSAATLDTILPSAQRLLATMQSKVLTADPTEFAYWSYHLARTAFFNACIFLGPLVEGLQSGSLFRGRVTFANGETDIANLVNTLLVWMPGEAIRTFEEDLKLIQQGHCGLPWDMDPKCRQVNPVFLADQFMRGLNAGTDVLAARGEGDAAKGRVPYGRMDMYPDYYQNNFHFQTDGWFSSSSAKVYEIMTEALFVGRQDAMQRAAFVPLAKAAQGHPGGAGLKMMEVAAGTGRFSTFVRDAYPAADLTVSDLSLFYLEEARSGMQHWAEVTGKAPAGATEFVQCAAEALPKADASMDIVYCMYLFHEMPDHARDAALAEMFRVLKPGGTLVLADSLQLGDRPSADAGMEIFETLNEPHYPTFVRYDFSAKLQAAGFTPGMKLLSSVTKVLSATKPE